MYPETNEEFIQRFKEFVNNYLDINEKPIYLEQLQRMSLEGLNSLIVDLEELSLFDPQLFRFLIEYPDIALNSSNKAVFELMQNEDSIYAQSEGRFFARFKNILDIVEIRNLKNEHAGAFISIQGKISSLRELKEIVSIGCFQCDFCGEIMYIYQDNNVLNYPKRCHNPLCAKKKNFQLITEESTWIEYRIAKIQQRHKTLPNKTPVVYSIEAEIYGDICNQIEKGDKITASCILRLLPRYKRMEGKEAVFKKVLRVNHIARE